MSDNQKQVIEQQQSINAPEVMPAAKARLSFDEKLASWALKDDDYKNDPAYQVKYLRARELLDELDIWERMEHKNDPFRAIEITKKLSEIRTELAELNKVPRTIESVSLSKINDSNGHRMGQLSSDFWSIKAKEFAKEYIDRHRKQNLFPSQFDVCEAVESRLRSEGIYGAHGKPVSATYIQRNAIQGDWWKNNRP